MLPKSLIKGFDRHRLRNLLLFFFAALAVPTAVLIWQAYSQLKWEAFHQYRGAAEELTRRIDARLIGLIDQADGRSYADYTFLVVTGDPSANFVQRSPLSDYPVTGDMPGVLGYFQVDTNGVFSTPLLPQAGAAAGKLGIGAEEYGKRQKLAQDIQAVLADNRLVEHRPETAPRPRLFFPDDAALGADAGEIRASPVTQEAELFAELLSADNESLEEPVVGGLPDSVPADKDAADTLLATPLKRGVGSRTKYSQQVFDELNQPKTRVLRSVGGGTMARNESDGLEEQHLNTLGKVADLKLDDAYQKKSEDIERKENDEIRDGLTALPARSKRREQIALPESVSPADEQAVVNGPIDLRISTFESEVDPLEFSLLNSGHFVLFRKVWRDGNRYIQGILIDQDAFIADVIDSAYRETAVAGMSNLIVAFRDDVIHSVSGRATGISYPSSREEFDGALLYRNRLSAPLDGLELIFSITRLPPGPGARVLGWVTLVLAIVFVGGFVTLYRLGLSQINLARQQQDFVSAVSHELKTPLTSIRMYGEMLKEGWADEEKRQSYYEFIHDEAERLTRLISNVLQLAKITRNEPQFDIQAVNVGELMSNIDSKISSQVKRAGYELRIERDEQADQATINVDEDCFAQIVINLVDNAIKFSKNADEKVIALSSNLIGNGEIRFAVRDYGPGVPKEQMKKIFKLFYRSESELTRETVGTGIGLAIVHQLTVAMGGKVDVVNLKRGAEFRVTFVAS